VRTALEQELGLAAYFVSNEIPLEKGAKNEALESDGEKLSSTDNEDEEPGTEGEDGLAAPRCFCHTSSWTSDLGDHLHLCRQPSIHTAMSKVVEPLGESNFAQFYSPFPFLVVLEGGNP
jgi:hypothetical protein